jgi:hypothetical protein
MQINQKINILGQKSLKLNNVCKQVYKKHIDGSGIAIDDPVIEQKL